MKYTTIKERSVNDGAVAIILHTYDENDNEVCHLCMDRLESAGGTTYEPVIGCIMSICKQCENSGLKFWDEIEEN